MTLKKALFTLFFPVIELQALILSLLLLAFRSKQKLRFIDTVIVKPDAIGDYVLFRNFLELLHIDMRTDDGATMLIGNIKCKDLAEECDTRFVDEFVWVDYDKLFNNAVILNRYTIALVLTLRRYRFRRLLCPVYSRNYIVDRFIVKNCNAQCKVAMNGDNLNMPPFAKAISDRFYTKLVEIDEDNIFEFYKNRAFFESILDRKMSIEQLSFPDRVTCKFIPTKDYAVLFPGAGKVVRRWPTEKFAEIADYLISRYGYQIIIAGSKADRKLAKAIIEKCLNREVIDLTGRTSLAELGAILRESKLLVSNDTSAVHIAASVEANTIFFLLGNNSFGRFGPYPPSFKNMHALYPLSIEMTDNNYHELAKRFKTFPRLKMRDIGVEKVKRLIEGTLQG